ncbi:autoinducer 2 ABC transporter substrate-binding protein [Cellulomonas carbonis]|uniref:autoinducer 2 ABC transporter substrate-binding protein n=1 Tax=Cellulomonas carbonis TaxID=1386092 RepID=UPI0005BD7A07|nr:autoinducer 2 ABC transporter substrate-binding protein [Cellulomonas carbonis]GGC15981.1 rhamnose ABC transporter substrate-binding protein [Cellulomonas carbonis]
MNGHLRRRRRAVVTVVAAAAGLLLAACSTEAPTAPAAGGGGETQGEDASGDEDMKIFMAPKFTGLAYFEVAREGGERAGEELGIEFEYIGSDKAEATEQIATLTNAIPQAPDALVVSAIDGDAVAPALKQARDAGIKVVTYDADAAVDARDLFVNQLSYELAASTMLDAALLNSPEGGLVAFISASPTAPNHTAHVRIMKELIDTDPKYSSLSYVDTVQFAGDDATKSQELALNLIQANPDLKVIISSSAVSAPAAQQAIINAGKSGEVFATGVALPSSVRDFIKDGHSTAFMMWDPAELGYIATVAAHQLVTGEITAEEGQMIDAGEAGTYEVLADGEVQYNKPLMFTADNIDDFDF